MKRITTIIIGLSLLITLSAQKRNEQFDQQIKEKRIKFIRQQVKFTPQEDEQFWTVYNKFDNDKKQIKEAMRKEIKQLKSKIPIDYEKINDARINTSFKEATLKVEFYQELKKHLPSEKIYLFYQAEKEFKRTLLDKVKGKK